MNLRSTVAWGICIGVACGPRGLNRLPPADDEAARRAWEGARSGPMAPDYLAEKRAFLERALPNSARRSAIQAGTAVQWRNIGPFEDDPQVPWEPSRRDSGRLRVIVTHP